MTPTGLERIWRKNRGRLPHLSQGGFEELSVLSHRLHQSTAKFWGVVDQKLRHENRSRVHCFNFGNISVHYPWQAEAINYGLRLPMRITRAGTIRAQKSPRSVLHQVEAPYLVFGFDDATLAEEQLRHGFVITNPGSSEMVNTFEVVVPSWSDSPEAGGVLFYFLTKRLSFQSEPMDPLVLRGSSQELRRVRVTLGEPMLVEAGWVVLMLEGDHWMWGVVSAV